MSRHGSGKRRRASQEPEDTGSHASGEYATPDPGPPADPHRQPWAHDAPAPYETYAPQGGYDPRGTYDAPEGYDPYRSQDPWATAHDPHGTYGRSHEEPHGQPGGEAGPHGGSFDPGTHVDAPYETPSADDFDAPRGASAYTPAAHAESAGAGHTAGFPSVSDEAAGEPEDDDDAADTGTGLRPTPPPLEGDIVKLVAVGSLIWIGLFVAAWLERDSLGAGREWWPWCAIAGAGLGLFGLWYCRRLRDAEAD